MRPRKIYQAILNGSRNIRFEDLCRLAEAFGFSHVRTSGSHRIYRHSRGAMLNLQPDHNSQAKHYQVRQLLELIEIHRLMMQD